MKASLVMLLVLAGCSAGRITRQGDVRCIAVGKAKCEVCVPGVEVGDAQLPDPPALSLLPDSTPRPRRTRAVRPICRGIYGGNLGAGVVDVLDAAVTAAAAWWVAP